MNLLILIVLLIVGCEDVISNLDETLTGTYTLSNYLIYDNTDCTGASIIDSTDAALTLTQLDYSYIFDGNSVNIIKLQQVLNN